MKKLVSCLALILCVVSVFAACDKKMGKSGKREAYNYDMTDFVTLGKYKGIEVDSSSETFKNYYTSFFEGDVAAKDAYAKADFYLKNDTLRQQIARNGYEKIKNNFTYEERFAFMKSCCPFMQ